MPGRPWHFALRIYPHQISKNHLKNPRLGIYFWRTECESRALPRIEPEAYREELRELLASVLVDYSWEYVQRNLDDDELEILREEYGRYKRVVEAGLRR